MGVLTTMRKFVFDCKRDGGGFEATDAACDGKLSRIINRFIDSRPASHLKVFLCFFFLLFVGPRMLFDFCLEITVQTSVNDKVWKVENEKVIQLIRLPFDSTFLYASFFSHRFFWHKFYVYFSHFLFITSDESSFLCSRKVKGNFSHLHTVKNPFWSQSNFQVGKTTTLPRIFFRVFESHPNLEHPKFFPHCQFLCDFFHELFITFSTLFPLLFCSFAILMWILWFNTLKTISTFFSHPATLNSFLKEAERWKKKKKNCNLKYSLMNNLSPFFSPHHCQIFS